MNQRLKSFWHFITPALGRTLTLGALVVWIPVIIFAYCANQVSGHEPLPFDVPVLHYIHSLANLGLDECIVAVTQFGGIAFVMAATLVMAYTAYRYYNHRLAYLVLLVSGGAAVMNVLLKLVFHRSRPDLWQTIVTEHTYSFPSGHAMASSALAMALMLAAWRTRWRWPAVILGVIYTLLIGFTRLYLGVHYPSDILAGWCISFAWALVVYRVLNRKSA